MHPLKYLLAPISLCYGAILSIRHALYDAGILKPYQPALPTIVIGNLALGGTGKTPHTRLVMQILANQGTIAVLSRGYGRRSRGFLEVPVDGDADQFGDEPLLLKRAQPDARVFVGEDRAEAARKIERLIPDLQVLLLDDALQHRAIAGDMNLLLTTWDRPYTSDHLVPMGRLRDLRKRARRAQVVIVTKCPAAASPISTETWREKLRLRSEQQLYFSRMVQEEPRTVQPAGAPAPSNDSAVLLITGIADANALVDHLRMQYRQVEHLAFRDHHRFTKVEIDKAAGIFGNFAAGRNFVLTTEKDLPRLRPFMQNGPLKNIPLAVLPIRVELLSDEHHFERSILAHVATHQQDRRSLKDKDQG